jgi:site-specific DNA-methyltransferase (adenine-specific)
MKTVWSFTAPTKREKGFGKHPTQKPVELIKRCLRASTAKGDLVLDPFMGSGTTGVACLATNRRFVGIEIDSQHTSTAVQRIQNANEINGNTLRSHLPNYVTRH